ncbi:hypothetical protein OHA01_11405 [Micromonospora zamorensis]|uniref:hypothetical protein n=1 Tax=Micromonospora zamorensis TaxID=709883 RepID=UPI0038663322|nr:hypothetical protein OHA01_11405 [Micromonospora zamorensis]
MVTGLQARADAAKLITWSVSVDSRINRAYQHASGAALPESEKHWLSGGTARVWADSVDLAKLTAVARSRVFRALTDDERQAHPLPGDADS